jgi:hypothetical protein
VFTQPWPATQTQKAKGRRDKLIYYQYRADRARRPARDRRAGRQGREGRRGQGLGQAEPVHHARRWREVGEPRPRGQGPWAGGLKGYTTHLANPSSEFVIGAYHHLWRIEQSFRMSKHDLRARPVYHHKRESIDHSVRRAFEQTHPLAVDLFGVDGAAPKTVTGDTTAAASKGTT